MKKPKPYSQLDMLIPLLTEIDDLGGSAKPKDLYDKVATRMNIDEPTRQLRAEVPSTNGSTNVFERDVRWAKQQAVAAGLVDGKTFGIWALTDRAKMKLKNIVRGTIVTVFRTDAGIVLWGNAEDVVGIVEPESVQLLCTSPPYALLTEKTYGNLAEKEYIDWFMRLAEGWRGLLTPTGSMAINLGVAWKKGMAAQSLYVERLLIKLEDDLGLYRLQKILWESPNRPGGGIEYVNIRRNRLKSTVEDILWLSPAPDLASADNRQVLKPYSKSMLHAIANPKTNLQKRPSGYTFGASSYKDNGGAIPSALIVASNSSSNDAFRNRLREEGREPHPATQAEAVADFMIRLTTQVNDTVYDPFGGTGVTGIAAQKLGRRFILNERSHEYIEQCRLRCETSGIATYDVARLVA